MIKRTISFSLIIILFLLVYQFLFTIVKDNHYVKYTIENGDIFNIDEKYTKDDSKDYYLIKVSSDDKNFVFKLNNVFNKQKNIVKDVVVIEKGEYYCIGLDLVGDDNYSFPECEKDGITYSYNSVKDIIDFDEYIKKTKGKDYDRYNTESIKKNELGLIVNRSYIDDNEVVIVYGYKQMDLLYSNYSRTFSFSTMDNYKNTYGTLVGKYYMVPKITSLPTFSTYIRYDVVDGIKKEIELQTSVSKQSYINGVNDNKLYLFDRSSKIQLEIDPYSESVKEIGNTDNEGITYVNGKKESISVYDLEKMDVFFENKKDDYPSLDGEYITSNNYYAIYKKNDSYYKVYKEFQDSPILMFKQSDVKNIKVRDDNVYFIKDNGIYKYNEYGIFGLVFRNEFIYNYDNIYDIYLK